MGADPRDELREISASLRALVRWEEALSGTGWPEADGLAPVSVTRSERGSRSIPEPEATAPESSTRYATSEVASPGSESSPGTPSSPVAKTLVAKTPSATTEVVSSEGASTDLGGRETSASAPSEPEPATPASTSPTQILRVLQEQAATCTDCRLHEGRTKSVFARGTHTTDIAFVGEGPGYHEDQQGYPFVGKAGALLDKMVGAMGYGRDQVYVCNVVKCRPPNNRTPKPDEAAACSRFLEGQLDVVQPKVIVALGRCATERLGLVEPGGKGWRGRWGEWRGVPVMPTYHPAFLLRSPEFKRPVWNDLQAVLAKLGRKPPKRGG